MRLALPDVAREVAWLRSVGVAVSGRQLELALAAGALLVVNAAKENAPVVTGTLRRSLHVGGFTELTPDFAAGEGYDDIGGNHSDATGAHLELGTDLAYAARIEFGFIGIDALGRSYHQEPAPYLRPAWDGTEDAMQAEVMAALDQLLAAA
jgi:hypothetical protein